MSTKIQTGGKAVIIVNGEQLELSAMPSINRKGKLNMRTKIEKPQSLKQANKMIGHLQFELSCSKGRVTELTKIRDDYLEILKWHSVKFTDKVRENELLKTQVKDHQFNLTFVESELTRNKQVIAHYADATALELLRRSVAKLKFDIRNRVSSAVTSLKNNFTG